MVTESIRQQKVVLNIQTTSDACISFYDGDRFTPGFTIAHLCIGITDNTQTELIIGNWIHRISTPGILSSIRFARFEITLENNLFVVMHEGLPLFIDQPSTTNPIRFVTFIAQ